ncbi:hypothetical protein GBA52_005464 [Prunus armeniaca]|nr:hypothetical protein GBA52_005464 [Prunus armeniaca]
MELPKSSRERFGWWCKLTVTKVIVFCTQASAQNCSDRLGAKRFCDDPNTDTKKAEMREEEAVKTIKEGRRH